MVLAEFEKCKKIVPEIGDDQSSETIFLLFLFTFSTLRLTV